MVVSFLPWLEESSLAQIITKGNIYLHCR